MKKMFVFISLLVIILCGCSGSVKQKEWTYDLLKKDFGGIIEVDGDSIQNCLYLLLENEYHVFGYVQDIDLDHPDQFTMSASDSESTGIKVIQYEDPYYAESGELIYINGSVRPLNSFNDVTYYLCGDVSKEQDDREYLSVADFLVLMDKIYEQTYFKTSGIILSESYNDIPIYYLYPSEESYKKDKDKRIEVSFSENQSNIVGKEVVIMGKPFNDFIIGLDDCSIIEEK